MDDCEFEKSYTLLTTHENDNRGNKTTASDGNKNKGDKSGHKSSMFESVCSLVCHILGTGFLALPYAVQKGGLVTVVSLILVPLIFYYTGKILIECLYVKNNTDEKIRVRKNYKDIGKACWPRFGAIIVFVVHLSVLFSLASLYIVLCGFSMYGMLPGVPVSPRLWMTISSCILLPTLFIKHFSQVAWISLLSVIALTIAIIIILAYGVSTSSHWDISTIPLWDTMGGPIALSIIVYSYESQDALPTIEGNMRDPQRFNIMLALTYVCVFLVKAVFALLGFLAFSTNIQEVITNSIQLRSIKVAASLFVLLSVLFSYPFPLKTIIQCIEDSIDLESLPFGIKESMWHICIRFTMNLLVLLPAVTIPHFALMMSLISSVTTMLVALIFPCIFHLRLHTEKLCWYHKFLDYCIIIFGFVAGVFGLIASVDNLIRIFINTKI